MPDGYRAVGMTEARPGAAPSVARPAAGLVARLKPVGRRLVDRVVQPYVDQVVDRVGPRDGVAALPPPLWNLQEALHEARTLALADVPPGAATMLSAGASGAWYFEWVERTYGRLDRHIGVEAYSPRPESLPANVEWLAADIAGDDGIPAVETASVDLVFSGQNVEHLWPRQMVRFLTETNRVLRPGGLVVVDSPNRALTAAYRWSMREHTVELTPDEASALLDAAGFSVERMKGVWLCRHGGELLPLGPDPMATGAGAPVRRYALASKRPDDSFIWWAEARKVGDPDAAALTRAVHRLFEDHWPERVARVEGRDASPRRWTDGRPGVVALTGEPCCVLAGPSMPLPPGAFRFSVEVAWRDCGDPTRPVATLEVLSDGELLASDSLRSAGRREGSATLSCGLTLDELRFGVGVRLVASGNAEVRAPLSLSVDPAPWRALIDEG